MWTDEKDDEFYKLGISEKKSTRARDEGYRISLNNIKLNFEIN